MKILKKIILGLVIFLVLAVGIFYAYRKITQKTIVIFLYDNFTMLEAVGAYQTFPGLVMNNYTMKFVAKEKGIIKSNHIQTLKADYSFSDIKKADILYIPGGENIENTINDKETIEWIKKIDSNSDYTMSVGAGSLLLGKAGILEGKNASTHWYLKDQLEGFGAIFTNKNYVRDGKIYTGMGASASIDMIFEIINEVAGEKMAKATQLFIEYDPSPPINSNTYDKADSTVLKIANGLVNNSFVEVKEKKTIAMLVYEGFTMLDITGPYQVFKELEPLGYEMKFVAKDKGIVKADMMLTYDAKYGFDEVNQADILFIPGGTSTAEAMKHKSMINWVQKIDKTTMYTTSVCTGSLVLAKAGVLKDKNASSHWYAGRFLHDYDVNFTHERYTIDGKYITGAGVSSGIDFALLIVKEAIGEDYAKAIQLKMGYFPDPIFDSGSPEKSDEYAVNMLSNMFTGAEERFQSAKEVVIELE